MNDSLVKIAKTKRFRENAEKMPLKKLRQYYSVGEATLWKMLNIAGVAVAAQEHVSVGDFAPTIEEELASQSSLALAPLVAKEARKEFDRHLEERRNESDKASQIRGYRAWIAYESRW